MARVAAALGVVVRAAVGWVVADMEAGATVAVEMARVVAVRAAVGMVVVMAEAVAWAGWAVSLPVARAGAARVEGKSGRLRFA